MASNKDRPRSTKSRSKKGSLASSQNSLRSESQNQNEIQEELLIKPNTASTMDKGDKMTGDDQSNSADDELQSA